MIVVKRDFGLDFARALAIMLVFFGHSLGTVGVSLGLFWYIPALGVDIFFALSGFLIGKILISLMTESSGYLTVKQILVFLYRRWIRTVPLYLVAIGIHFLVDRYILKNDNFFNWKFLFWVQYVKLGNQANLFFCESWSLCVEELFYLSFSIGLLLFAKATRNSKICINTKIMAFTTSYVLIIVIIRMLFCGNSPDVVLTQYRLDAIGYGVLASIFYYCYNIKINNILIGILAISLLPIGIILYVKGFKLPFLLHISYTVIGLGAALVVLFVKIAGLKAKKFLVKPITFLSKISYSIYLSNLVIIELAILFFRKNLDSISFFLVLFSFEIVFSTITYYLVELPFLKNRDWFLQKIRFKKMQYFPNK